VTTELYIDSANDLANVTNESVTRTTASSDDTLSESANQENPVMEGEELDSEKLLLQQKQELQEFRNYGLVDQEKILANVAQEAIEMLAQDQNSKSSTPDPEATSPTDGKGLDNDSGRHNKSKILTLLNESLVDFCHDNLYFVEFVHITGRFSFNVDNREVSA
jgi:hypothetical protein